MKIKLSIVFALGTILGCMQTTLNAQQQATRQNARVIIQDIQNLINDAQLDDARAMLEGSNLRNVAQVSYNQLALQIRDGRAAARKAPAKEQTQPSTQLTPALATIIPPTPATCSVQPLDCPLSTADIIADLEGTMADLTRYIKEPTDTENLLKQTNRWLGAIHIGMETITCANPKQDLIKDACKKSHELNYLVLQDLSDTQLTKVNQDTKALMNTLKDITSKLIPTIKPSSTGTTQTIGATVASMPQTQAAPAQVIALDEQGLISGYSYKCSVDKTAGLKTAQQNIKLNVAESIKTPIDINQALKWYTAAFNAIKAIQCVEPELVTTQERTLLSLGKTLYTKPSMQTLGTTMLAIKDIMYELDEELTQLTPYGASAPVGL